MAKVIKTRRGDVLVDDDLYELIKGRPIAWNGSYPAIRLHHLALGPLVEGHCVDHIDRNPLNARRANLRACSYTQNRWNSSKCKSFGADSPATSKFIGVSYHPRTKKFRMRLTRKEGGMYIRYDAKFESEVEAARVRDICALAEHGEHAALNFNKEDYAGIKVEHEASKYAIGRNIRLQQNKSSIYRGVSLDKNSGKFYAAVKKAGYRYHIGTFDAEIEAAKAYDQKAGELFGARARLNFR
jgi:hypothetical protein